MSRSKFKTLAALLVATALAACSSAVKLDEPAQVVSRDTPAAAALGGPGAAPGAATASGAPQSQVATVDLARQRAEQAARDAASTLPRIVYFDFDSFVLRDEYRPLVEGHAKSLITLSERRVSLQGHADERGGREYNLALGQKRAEAVARALELLGVNPAQIEAVSFGEERPAVPGHDEAAWAKNRRVELKDK